jgi:DNA-binding NarL/FixJ family response regulator
MFIPQIGHLAIASGRPGGYTVPDPPGSTGSERLRQVDVVLASTQLDLRLALEILLREEPGTDIVGTASAAAGLRALLQAARPELLLLDWDLPGHPPASLLAEARVLDPPPSGIVLGREQEVKPAALAAGSDAFFLRGDPPAKLLATVRQVRSRRRVPADETFSKAKGD